MPDLVDQIIENGPEVFYKNSGEKKAVVGKGCCEVCGKKINKSRVKQNPDTKRCKEHRKVCEGCGKEIPPMRLNAIPDARRCTKCQSSIESCSSFYRRY